MPDFEIRPFHANEAETIAHWATDEDDLWKLTGARDEPLSADRIAAWTWESNFSFTLRYQGDLVAYAEIIEDEVDSDVEIQHLLVAPDFRGQGIGRAMLSRLCAFLSAGRPFPEVWLRVGRDNEPAARCALSVGFVEDAKQGGPRYAWYKRQLKTAAPAIADEKTA